MNQHRWTCLSTLILTAVLAPIAQVQAKVPSSVEAGDNYSPSPQSLPTITPLTVSEIETDAVLQVANQVVPQVSKLPTIASLADRHQQRQKATLIPLRNRHLDRAATPISTSIFNPKSQATRPIVSTQNPLGNSINSAAAPVAAVMPQPTGAANPAFTSFISQTATTPILVVHSDRARPTIITNSTTAQAEIDRLPQPQQTLAATAIDTSTPRSEIIPVPQVAPIFTGANNRSDPPSFEAGLPVFIFDNERPQQIVATVIAQIDNDIVAPEPSIAIPVERPKRQNIPARRSIPAALAQPIETESAKIEQPDKVQPALDKIVATHTGQASWYGSEAGSKTANGERYNPRGLTAAHRTLPFGTKVRVTSIITGKAVVVRINDRGPFHRRRMIDVSAGAAEAIGLKNTGIGAVRIDILALGE
ncbi:septal ring lytic transglycosylase RlpA family protein [Chamaesiphon sp.]|uniref:septal ring lytic transglycosylase RlpA family protein n=1 Tax=Chamaesiphon sp. TaxID=2814140 RepID=UPI003593F17F